MGTITGNKPTIATVADLAIDGVDGLGQVVTCIYGRKPPTYGVYGSEKRVMVMYADAVATSEDQRRNMAHLAPVRGEIDGLIDGWRHGTTGSFLDMRSSRSLMSKAHRYNRRVADALIVALEGDCPTASTILGTIKQDITDERTAHARFEYLIAAMLTALALMFGSVLVISAFQMVRTDTWLARSSSLWPVFLPVLPFSLALFLYASFKTRGGDTNDDAPARTLVNGACGLFILGIVALFLAVVSSPDFMPLMSVGQGGAHLDLIALWRAAAAGSIGAFFSIAIGIRGRTILTDLLSTSNLMDAVLRVSIGFIAAGVLMALLIQNAVTVVLGSIKFNDAALLSVLIAGFVAGFSERLVPDLLAKFSAQVTGATSAKAADGSATATTTSAGSKAAASSPSTSEGAKAETAAPDPHAHEAGVDGCVCDKPLAPGQQTDDADLPVASGGVDKR